MATATAKPDKRLGEFLKEQQEPFILEVYLLERGNYSKNWSSNGDHSTKSLEKKRKKSLFPIFKALTVLHKKLAFHNQSNGVPQEGGGSVDQTVVETDRFSTASSSTMFNSCSDIDEDDATSFSSHKDNPLFSPDTCQSSGCCHMKVQSQQDTNNGKHRQRCIEVSVTHETLNKDVSVWGIEQRIHSCGVLVPKKITEDSLLSAAIWSSFIHTAKRDENYTKELQELLGYDVSQVLKPRRVMQHKTKQLLFDCVREITKNLPRKDGGCRKQLMGPEKLGKMIWERTKEWSQRRSGNETNLTNLLNLDYLDSVNEWSEFKLQVKDISVEIADEILDRVNNEIVSEMIEILLPTM